ncbi:MAG: SpoIIE family protein phosphatase [Treponema sp.]|jgi:sigma-B regulation protein RsbU (phosphoserine phosphatase)|nr:SpoIIE family protein phosphatase [Treponema sp.]
MRIKRKVLTVILASSLGALALLSLTGMISIFNIRRITLSHSNALGDMAARKSQEALETQVRRELLNFAQDKADLIDEKFLAVQQQTKMTAEIATYIYTYKEQYKPKPINYLQIGEVGTTVPYVMTAPGVSLAAIREEVGLAANVAALLRQIVVMDMGIMESYIAGETGYTIMVEKNASAGNNTTFDGRSRSWYKGAKERDGLFWSGVFTDAFGHGASISCAIPFYDDSEGNRVLRGVAGNGTTLTEVDRIINASKIGQTGYAFLLDDRGRLIIGPETENNNPDGPERNVGEEYLQSSDPAIRDLAERMIGNEKGVVRLQLSGEDVYVAYCPLSVMDFSLGIVLSADEVTAPVKLMEQDIIQLTRGVSADINTSIVSILLIIAAVIVAAVFAALYVAFRLSRSLTAPIIKLCQGAEIISGGDLNYQLAVDSDDEIGILARTFNQMIGDIKKINGEKERINGELTAAADIQNNMLPRIFPKFARHQNLALFAKMAPAKEVGGDFYDFFYLNRKATKIACIIADVSGKGVPAALFMVIAKTLLKIHLLRGMDPAATLDAVNKLLCEDNPQSMFVTVFLCTLDLSTGQMSYANGGHNPPLIALGGGPFRFMELKKGVPLGMFEASRYKLCELFLHDGDKLYLYTDGVNEAMNGEGDQFGNDRFLEKANANLGLPPERFDQALRQELALFVNGAEQSDDITTLAIAYTRDEPPGPISTADTAAALEKELVLPASTDHLDRLLDWIEEVLQSYDCPAKTRYQITVMTEEIFMNIVHYAYPENTGDVVVRVDRAGERYVVQYEDQGLAFNPLEQARPDTKASLEERTIGGLGIHLVREMADDLSYARVNGKNQLTIYKAPGPAPIIKESANDAN